MGNPTFKAYVHNHLKHTSDRTITLWQDGQKCSKIHRSIIQGTPHTFTFRISIKNKCAPKQTIADYNKIQIFTHN